MHSFDILRVRMLHPTHLHTLRTVLFVILLTGLSGCFVFEPVGNAISQGYENTVTYFNAFYNVRRLFRDAEDEVLTAQLANRGKDLPTGQATQIPAGAKQKLTQVIDKCSNILAFHASSSFVDNALLMIGKSYFYQGEYLKAERKFTELVTQFPSSSLLLEAQLWFGRSELQRGDADACLKTCENLIAQATAQGDDEILLNASMVMADAYRIKKQDDKALERYAMVIGGSGDDETKALAEKTVGDIFVAQEQYGKSIEAYGKVPDFTNDVYLLYSSKLQAAIASGKMKSFEAGLSMLNEMLDDVRFKENIPNIRLEKANLLAAQGRRDDALDEYRYLDTTYARTEPGMKASFSIARIFETELKDYSTALTYYTKVTTAQNFLSASMARRKYLAIGRYFEAMKKLSWVDSVRNAKPDTSIAATNDTSKPAPQKVVVSPDSLRKVLAEQSFELGEIFYSELPSRDSASAWYHQALSLDPHGERAPRVLYVLAELSRSDSSQAPAAQADHYRKLVEEFPDSPYANEARRFLGLQEQKEKADPAGEEYRRAEVLIDSSRYGQAIGALSSIVQSYPKSTFAPKSEYAVGWIYEHRLAQPESARAHYTALLKNYATTQYAQAVQKRLLVPEPPPAATDSSGHAVQPVIPPPGLGFQKADSAKVQPAKMDTLKAVRKEVRE
ncbi:MAG: tetratricopeptide repeat protein [Bacteroidota bacterium]